MPMRHAGPQALAPGRSSVAAGHVGRGPGLIDEHEARRVEIKLIVEPLLPSSQDVRPVLLGRVCGLFLRVIRRRAKKRHSVP